MSPSNDPVVVSRNLIDLTSPRVVVEIDAEQAEPLGAFEEDALTQEDAWAANADLGMESDHG